MDRGGIGALLSGLGLAVILFLVFYAGGCNEQYQRKKYQEEFLRPRQVDPQLKP